MSSSTPIQKEPLEEMAKARDKYTHQSIRDFQ